MGKADAIGCGQTYLEFVYFTQVPREKRTISQQRLTSWALMWIPTKGEALIKDAIVNAVFPYWEDETLLMLFVARAAITLLIYKNPWRKLSATIYVIDLLGLFAEHAETTSLTSM